MKAKKQKSSLVNYQSFAIPYTNTYCTYAQVLMRNIIFTGTSGAVCNRATPSVEQ